MTRKNTIKKIPEGQERLPFSSRTRSSVWAHAHPFERKTALVFGVAFVLLSVLYIYFMIFSVVHVAARQELARAEAKTSAEVATLETAYLAKTQTFTEPYAKSLGFVSVKTPTFVSKGGVAFATAH